ncbi:MAG: hypothetical protein ACXWJ8_02510 [Xanthobacteraceae bacterium]
MTKHHWRAAVSCAASISLLLLFVAIAVAEVQPAPTPPVPSPAPPQAGKPIGCEPGDVRPRAGGASIAPPANESLQHKSWQPIGGMIEFTINSFVVIPADASITTCFRWKVEPAANARPFNEARPARVELTNGGKSLKVTVAIPEITEAAAETKKEKALAGLAVPLAEVRILAIKADNTLAADVWTEVGITRPWISLLLALATVVAGFVLLNIAVRFRITHEGILRANWLLRIISTPAATASLSQLQIILWTFVVAASAVYVVTLSGQLVQITTGTLILLGISGAAILAAQAHDANKTAGKDAAQTAAKEAATAHDKLVAESADPKVIEDAKKKMDDAQAKAADATAIVPPDKVPQWSDLIVSQDAQGNREIDVTRVQMLLFTVITASFVVVKVIAAYVIPEIPDGYLVLMGISNGVYVGSKVVQKS